MIPRYLVLSEIFSGFLNNEGFLSKDNFLFFQVIVIPVLVRSSTRYFPSPSETTDLMIKFYPTFRDLPPDIRLFNGKIQHINCPSANGLSCSKKVVLILLKEVSFDTNKYSIWGRTFFRVSASSCIFSSYCNIH